MIKSFYHRIKRKLKSEFNILNKRIKKILKPDKTFYSLSIIVFLLLTFFVCFYAILRLLISPSQWIYVRVKIGPNMLGSSWPEVWFIKSLKVGEKERDTLGQTTAEILAFRYYPVGQSFNIFIDLKLKTKINKMNDKISFKRRIIEVSAPVYLEFPSSRVSGTIISFSKTPFKDKLIEKTIYLIAPGGYSEDLPYRYESIQVGDSYFNGEEVVFKILDKKIVESKFLATNINADVFERINKINQHIVVKAMVKVKEMDERLVFGEDQVVLNGRFFNPATNNFDFGGYAVGKIE